MIYHERTAFYFGRSAACLTVQAQVEGVKGEPMQNPYSKPTEEATYDTHAAYAYGLLREHLSARKLAKCKTAWRRGYDSVNVSAEIAKRKRARQTMGV